MQDARSWMFCPLTGALLSLDPRTGIASCSESAYSVDLTSKAASCPKEAIILLPVTMGMRENGSLSFFTLNVDAELDTAKVISSCDIEVSVAIQFLVHAMWWYCLTTSHAAESPFSASYGLPKKCPW